MVEAAQHLLAAIELGHRGAEAVEDRGELAGDVAAADHHQPLRERSRSNISFEVTRARAPGTSGGTGQPPVAIDDALGAWTDAVHLDGVRRPTRRPGRADRSTPALVSSSP